MLLFQQLPSGTIHHKTVTSELWKMAAKIHMLSLTCTHMCRSKRLFWYLERNNLITLMQSGFRKGQSTTAQLVRFCVFWFCKRSPFIQQQHVTAVFFDLEKAYDTTWKYYILKDLHDAGLRGWLSLFIAGFLCDRKFQVRVGRTNLQNRKWVYYREAFYLLLFFLFEN